MTTELKPCPFCGGEAHDPDARKEKILKEAGMYFRPGKRCISCKSCGASVGTIISHKRVMCVDAQREAIEKSVEKWNRRVNDA